jgi:ketosteroid isomerase-like protein
MSYLIIGAIMKKIILLNFMVVLLFTAIITSCSSNKGKILTQDQIKNEEKEITNVIKAYMNALQAKNFSPILTLLSKDVVFYGSSAGETIKNIDQIKAILEKQWKEWDIQYGEIVDVFIKISYDGSLASVIYGVPITYKKATGEQGKYFLRYSVSLMSNKEKWEIVSGIVSQIDIDHVNADAAQKAEQTTTVVK